MRKLLVLTMTSVLATGAIANADQVTVVANAADYIHIDGIYDPDNNEVADGGNITPYFQDGAFIVSASNAYTLSVEVLDDVDTLEQVAICLYDSFELTSENLIEQNCDIMGRTAGELNDSFVLNDASRESALTAAYFPGEVSSSQILTRADRHLVITDSFTPASTVTTQDDLGTTSKGFSEGNVTKLDFKFALSDLAENSAGWKIRVFAEYKAGDNITEVVTTSEESYTVSFLGTMTETSRGDDENGNVDFGDIIPGESNSAASTNGQYRANNTADITLEADTKFFGEGDGGAIEFVDGGSPSGNQVSLGCSLTGVPLK